MSKEQWWNNGDRRNQKKSEKKTAHKHFVYHKYHLNRTGIELALSR